MADMTGYQYGLVEKLSFVRYGGTQEELAAANILLDEIKSFGGQGELMPFDVAAFDLEKCSVRVTEPFKREVSAIPYGCSGSLPKRGKNLKLFYAERGTELDFEGMDDLSGYAVMLNALDLKAYGELVKRHASAFITIAGKYYDDLDSSSAYSRNLRPKYLEKGKIPGFIIPAGEATDLIRDGAQTLHMELRQTEKTNESRNVLAVIEGTDKADEGIALTAHYDSVPLGTGSWDNATGSATLMYVYRYFLENRPRRTMRFIWCGSEEQGLLGSKAYVEKNEDLLDSITFCFNFDMCGTVLGPNQIIVTGKDELETFVKQFCDMEGYSTEIRSAVHSSDSAPFADKGIPGIGISRGTRTAEIHTHKDLMFPLGAKQLKDNGDFACRIISKVVNSVALPVEKGMSDRMLKELDKYFQRETKE